MSFLTGVAKVAGAGKAVAFAQVFGSGAALDAYLLAFVIPSFVADVFCGSLIPVLVPAFVEVKHREGVSAASALQAVMQRTSLRYSSVLGVLIATAGFSLYLLAPASENLKLAAGMVGAMAPILPLTALANVWRAALNAQQRFLVPAASAIAVPTILVTSVLILGQTVGVWVLAWATTLAVVAEVLILMAGMRAAGNELFPRGSAPFPTTFLREYGSLTAVSAVSLGGVLIGQFIAAALGEGAVSLLNYGTRLTAVVLSIGPAALGATILPRFAEMAAKRHGRSLLEFLSKMLLTCSLASLGVAILLMVFSEPIIRLTLQHGAFTAKDTNLVALVQQLSLIQFPFVVAATLLMRTLAALGLNRSLLPVSFAGLVVNGILTYLLSLEGGTAGIALASSLSHAFMCLALLWIVYRGQGHAALAGEAA